MTLPSGMRLGPYEILSPLGAGGMGEVYRAKDPKLDRLVAIKVLPEHLAKDADALSRFEREAKALGSLQHPNVLGIFDFGADQAFAFAVMELLEGETLREALRTGPLPRRKGVEVCVQIARGLAAAHGKGILHRDLKPENIFVMKDGQVKLLDFGLAKAMRASDPHGPTEALGPAHGTEKGMILGTVGYLSPEQVRGGVLDARSDIFSAGAVMFEIFTGQRAFARSTAAETMTAILKEDPPDTIGTGTSFTGPLRRIVDHCLEKDPGRRFPDSHGLTFALESAALGTSGTQAQTGPLPAAARPWRKVSVLVGACLALVSLGVMAGRWSSPGASGPSAMRFEVIPPPGIRFESRPTDSLASISPDGRWIAFVGQREDGRKTLWIRPVFELEATELPGTEDGEAPFWSPDSRSVAFFADHKLKRIDPSGGQPRTLCDVPDPYPTGSWGTQGAILFAGIAAPTISLVAEGGGTPRATIRVDASRQELNAAWPSFLPDGRRFLYCVRRLDQSQPQVRIGSTNDAATTELLSSVSRAAFVPDEPGATTGRILFVREGLFLAQPFDAGSLRLKGEAVPAGQAIRSHAYTGLADFSASENGVLVTRDTRGLTRLAWFDRDGGPAGLLDAPGNFSYVRISPDASRVAVNRVDPRSGLTGLWMGDIARGVLSRIDSGPGDYQPVAWSPDGATLALTLASNGHPPLLHTLPIYGSEAPKPLQAPGGVQWIEDWSQDGKLLLYSAAFYESGPGLWALDTTGAQPARKLFSIPELQGPLSARISPDGRWIAYTGAEMGRREVYLSPLPGPGERIRVSIAGGSLPRWRRDGRELYFVSATGQLMAAPIRLGSRPQAGVATALFRLAESGWLDYDVTPDGKRFLVVEKLPTEGPDAFIVTSAWTSRLGR